MLAVLRNPCKRQVRMSKAKITSCYGMAWWIYNGFIRILTKQISQENGFISVSAITMIEIKVHMT